MRNDILSRPAIFLRQLDSGLDWFYRDSPDVLLQLCGINGILRFPRSKREFIERSENYQCLDCMSTIRPYVFRGPDSVPMNL